MISTNASVYSGNTAELTDLWYVNHTNETRYTKSGKRLFDLVIACLVCILVLSWLIPLIGIAIYSTSSGPILFIQGRTGRRGRTFRCYKFRTMYHGNTQPFTQASRNDPRITPLGRYLRRTNLDEMPQFLNVLLGDMSLVGPRPHAIEHDNQYWSSIDNYHFRYTVRPGISGIAQIRGARGETSELIRMRHRLRYDLHYMKRQSLSLDIWICWVTLKQMVMGTLKAW